MVRPVCVLEGREIVAPRVGLRAGSAHASGSVATRTTDGHLLTCCRQGSLVSPLAERAAFDGGAVMLPRQAGLQRTTSHVPAVGAVRERDRASAAR